MKENQKPLIMIVWERLEQDDDMQCQMLLIKPTLMITTCMVPAEELLLWHIDLKTASAIVPSKIEALGPLDFPTVKACV